ncbi:carnitine O-acetyltransferase yat1 [Tilletia horrida]|nr:carnitine O-acetyltransferase yat1 [Tilletia horrida]
MPPVADNTPVAAPPPSSAESGKKPVSPLNVGKTFKDQDKLPKLPIPDLQDTCNRYLASLEHLQTKDEHQATQHAVQHFLDNQGPALNQALHQYAKSKNSYIEEWWDESYLNASDSVVLNLNPFFILETISWQNEQCVRAASLILAALSFVHDLRTGNLEPDNVRGIPLDMYQYTRLFGTSRVPTPNGCKLEAHDESSHIVVLRRGQMYWFEALDQFHRPLFTEKALLQNLQAIVADADKLPRAKVAPNALGVLTTEQRKAWSFHRETLRSRSGENNAQCLQVIDSALFVVCLDDWAPAELAPAFQSANEQEALKMAAAGGLSSRSQTGSHGADLCNNMLCGTYKLEDGVQVGTCTNRWYDKLQIIVCSNGAAGINFEHTGVDGHTVLRFVADIYTELIMRFAKSINSATQSLFKAKTSPYAKGIGGKRPPIFDAPPKKSQDDEHDEEEELPPEFDTTPRKLEWDLNPELRDAIRFGETRLSDLICQNECQVLVFEGYGKSFLTRHRFSPDAFVQMAFQAAYYALYGRPATTYEPAMVKNYARGRTEAIRTVQAHSVHFTRTFYDEVSPAKTAEDKIAALRKACEGHTKLTRECSKGMGHDRHLYAMLQLWKKMQADKKKGGGEREEEKEESMPAIFSDPGFATLNTTILSTSNCGNPALRLFGFGPVSEKGYGLGYIIGAESLAICASSKHLQTGRFLDTLSAYLTQVGNLIIETYKAANTRPTATFIDHSGRECDVRTGRPLAEGAGAGGRYGHSRARRSAGGSALGGVEMGGSNGYDDFERSLNSQQHSRARPTAGTRREGSSTMGSAGYGFFDAGGGRRGEEEDEGGASKRERKVGRKSAAAEEIAGVGRMILISEY